MKYSRLLATGHYLPENIKTNDILAKEKNIETNDEWIISRSGIKQRHFASDDQKTSDLAYFASLNALEQVGISANDIDLIIVATSTPDQIFPSTATILQDKLKMTNLCPAFDVQAVCAGFTYAISIADKFIRSGETKRALVVGAETFSRIMNWNDRTTCVLFGDGAGAVILEASDTAGILSTHLYADGRQRGLLEVPGGVENGQVFGSPFLTMDGTAVFKFAVNSLTQVAQQALDHNNFTVNDLDWLIPHQANSRIIQSVAKKLNLPESKAIVTVDIHGNTSAASIPLALDIAIRDGRIKPNHLVLLEGIGGGFTWGSALLRI